MIIKGKIEAVSGPREYEGKMQIGLKVNGQWFNQEGKETELLVLMEHSVRRGNEIEFEAEKNVVKKIVRFEAAKAQANSKDDGNWQDDIVNFETLLNDAHEKKENFSIETQMLAIDTEKEYALFKAVISVTKDEKEIRRFEAHGDATNKNIIGEFIKPHYIRMAETRAIARALRWYTNNAQCSEEEKDKPTAAKQAKKEELKVTTEKIK